MKKTISSAFKLAHIQNNSNNNRKKILDAFSALLHQPQQDQASNKITNTLKSCSLLDMVEPFNKGKQDKVDKDNLQVVLNFKIKLQCQEQKQKQPSNKKKVKQNKENAQKLQKLWLQDEDIEDISEQKDYLQRYYLQSEQINNKYQQPQQCKFAIKLFQDPRILAQHFKQKKIAKKTTKKTKMSYQEVESPPDHLQEEPVLLKGNTIQEEESQYQQLSFKIPIRYQQLLPQNIQPQPENNQNSPIIIIEQQIQKSPSPLAYSQSQTDKAPQVQIIQVSKSSPWLTGKATLKQLIEEIFSKKLINQKLYKQFIQNHSFDDIKQYLQKFYSGRLHKFDFQKIKFTILDHRRFSELLINLFPGQYEIGKVKHMDPKANAFLNKLYEMTGEQYYKLYAKIDKISKIKWWSKILVCQSQKLVQNNKQKRLAQRKAEKAQLAVQQVLNQFHSKLPSPFTTNFNEQNNLYPQVSEKGVKRIKLN